LRGLKALAILAKKLTAGKTSLFYKIADNLLLKISRTLGLMQGRMKISKELDLMRMFPGRRKDSAQAHFRDIGKASKGLEIQT